MLHFWIKSNIEPKNTPGKSKLDTPETGQSPDYSNLDFIFGGFCLQQTTPCAQKWLSHLRLQVDVLWASLDKLDVHGCESQSHPIPSLILLKPTDSLSKTIKILGGPFPILSQSHANPIPLPSCFVFGGKV